MSTIRNQILGTVDARHRGPGSRRAFLVGSARIAAAGGLAVALKAASAGGGSAAQAAAGFADDLDVLHYLRSLEQAAHALYRDALIRFASDESTSGDRLLPKYPTLAKIRDQELGHLTLLTDEITSRGGQSMAAARYDFAYQDFAGFLRSAAELENAIVAAYADAVAAIEEPELRRSVAGVLAVEARHSAYMNERIGEPPFPAAMEAARSVAEVRTVADRFVIR
jgi:hypothetical protein